MSEMEKPSILFQYETQSYDQRGQEKAVQAPVDLKLDGKVLRSLSKLSPSKALTTLTFDWGLIFLMGFLQSNYLSLYFFPLTTAIIASRQQALGVILHDASHFLLMKNRKWNDHVADWLLAFPLNLTTYGYRREHFAHHKYSGLANDPDRIRLSQKHYQVDRTTVALIRKMLMMCTGLYVVREFYEMGYKYQLATNVPKSVNISRGLFALVAVTLITVLKAWTAVALYWFLPMMTLLMPILFYRLKAEHDRIPSDKMLNTRTVISGPIERFFVGQHNVNYHLDHHLFPSVPFYNLPKLHQELMKVERYKQSAHLSQGYFSGLWKELTTETTLPESGDSSNSHGSSATASENQSLPDKIRPA